MTDTKTLTETELLDQIKSLPDEIQKLLISTETNGLIQEIAESNTMTELETLALRQAVALTLLGFSHPSNLAAKIDAKIKGKHGERIAGEIQKKILDLVPNELAKIYPVRNSSPAASEIGTSQSRFDPKSSSVIISNGVNPVQDTGPEPEPVSLSAISMGNVPSITVAPTSSPASNPTIPPPPSINIPSDVKPVMLHQESTYRPVTLTPDISLKMRGQSSVSSSGTNDLFRSETPIKKSGRNMIAEIEFGKMSGDSSADLQNKIPAFNSSNLTPFKPTTPPSPRPIPPLATAPSAPKAPSPAAPTPVSPSIDRILAPKDSWDTTGNDLPLPPPITKPNSLLSPLFKRSPSAATPTAQLTEIPIPPPPSKR